MATKGLIFQKWGDSELYEPKIPIFHVMILLGIYFYHPSIYNTLTIEKIYLNELLAIISEDKCDHARVLRLPSWRN